jgi:hypothetical protein
MRAYPHNILPYADKGGHFVILFHSFVIRHPSFVIFYALPRFTGIGFPDSSTATSVKTPCVTRSSSPVMYRVTHTSTGMVIEVRPIFSTRA